MSSTNSPSSADNPEENRQECVTVVAQYCSSQRLPTDSSTSSTCLQHIHPSVFFYRPPNDFYHYLIKCNELTYDAIMSLLKMVFNDNDKENNMKSKENEYIFFYRQEYDSRFYQISCEIVSPLLVNNCLSKNFLGIELQQCMEQEHLAFNVDQKDFLEHHLKQYLSQYILN
ncbi:unnamed protein product [Rhizophagus irregularis]|uniref:Uncharacterized protein n=2 Tax=Rhizophagus irregularis TaxID=588596 RepID=A0A2I1EM43_9GLOM|nr:hypothetical protein RhiirC2_745372 [Rhizophagus irregularis]PKY23187.1 hypothetical protein RhiirB3_526329 [Rhizophagus irregularis]CAB4393598.1 unnamed protein product [Rhizophagus irregularis]CAB5162529.1 unnamed protein product [Rhizophagus irregularis]CAB5362487.1 unnamed protein product [Rhizophagus irregularis]